MDLPVGAIATRQCSNPNCLAERGERHEPDCTPETFQGKRKPSLPLHLKARCSVHGLQTFVRDEEAFWWRCPELWDGITFCRSVVTDENFTPDGSDVVWWGPQR